MGENIAFVASLRLDVSDPSSSESEHSCWAGAAAGAFGGVARPDLRRHPAEAALNGVAIKPGALPLDHARVRDGAPPDGAPPCEWGRHFQRTTLRPRTRESSLKSIASRIWPRPWGTWEGGC